MKSWNEIRKAARKFREFWTLATDSEVGNYQKFWFSLLGSAMCWFDMYEYHFESVDCLDWHEGFGKVHFEASNELSTIEEKAMSIMFTGGLYSMQNSSMAIQRVPRKGSYIWH